MPSKSFHSNENLYNDAEPFLEVYPDYDLTKLPRCISENIQFARVYGGGKRCVVMPDGRTYHMDNKLNDLSGGEWMFFINSVLSTHYSTRGKESYAHDIRKMHPSPKPPQLMRDIISFFTKEGELILDTFMGVGGTLLGAALCNRQAVGFDLNRDYIDAYIAAANELGLPVYKTLCGDSLSILQNEQTMKEVTSGCPVSLLLIDPPYSNMMSRKKTGGDVVKYGKNSTPFTDDSRDLGNMGREEFLCSLVKSVELALPYIKKHGYVVMFIKDIQPYKKETNLLHAEVVTALNNIPGLFYKGLKIWADESAKIFPYGYPFSFVANQIHQYILVFRKE